MVLTLIQQGLGLRPREKRALCGKMRSVHNPVYFCCTRTFTSLVIIRNISISISKLTLIILLNISIII